MIRFKLDELALDINSIPPLLCSFTSKEKFDLNLVLGLFYFAFTTLQREIDKYEKSP